MDDIILTRSLEVEQAERLISHRFAQYLTQAPPHQLANLWDTAFACIGPHLLSSLHVTAIIWWIARRSEPFLEGIYCMDMNGGRPMTGLRVPVSDSNEGHTLSSGNMQELTLEDTKGGRSPLPVESATGYSLNHVVLFPYELFHQRSGVVELLYEQCPHAGDSIEMTPPQACDVAYVTRLHVEHAIIKRVLRWEDYL